VTTEKIFNPINPEEPLDPTEKTFNNPEEPLDQTVNVNG